MCTFCDCTRFMNRFGEWHSFGFVVRWFAYFFSRSLLLLSLTEFNRITTLQAMELERSNWNADWNEWVKCISVPIFIHFECSLWTFYYQNNFRKAGCQWDQDSVLNPIEYGTRLYFVQSKFPFKLVHKFFVQSWNSVWNTHREKEQKNANKQTNIELCSWLFR